MRNVHKYLPHYSAGATAEFVDGEFFTTIIKLEVTTVKTTANTKVKTSLKIIELILQNETITIPEIAQKLNKTTRAIKMAIAKLKKEKKLKSVGPDTGGYWKVSWSERRVISTVKN
ncbi:winged helix-turn-helix domain-containing protein [Calditrichota bacterium LG25]